MCLRSSRVVAKGRVLSGLGGEESKQGRIEKKSTQRGGSDGTWGGDQFPLHPPRKGRISTTSKGGDRLKSKKYGPGYEETGGAPKEGEDRQRREGNGIAAAGPTPVGGETKECLKKSLGKKSLRGKGKGGPEGHKELTSGHRVLVEDQEKKKALRNVPLREKGPGLVQKKESSPIHRLRPGVDAAQGRQQRKKSGSFFRQGGKRKARGKGRTARRPKECKATEFPRGLRSGGQLLLKKRRGYDYKVRRVMPGRRRKFTAKPLELVKSTGRKIPKEGKQSKVKTKVGTRWTCFNFCYR